LWADEVVRELVVDGTAEVARETLRVGRDGDGLAVRDPEGF
jgi:hypothetical protein